MNRTAFYVIIMIISAILGFFVLAFINNSDTGALLGAVIAGFACMTDALQNTKRVE